MLSIKQWLTLDGFSQLRYQAVPKQGHTYLAIDHEEGLNDEVLETTGRGIGIGFQGMGGQKHMISNGRQHNCLVVNNGNPLSLDLTLENAIQDLLRNARQYERIDA